MPAFIHTATLRFGAFPNFPQRIPTMTSSSLNYLSAEQALKVDKALMSPQYGFTLPQLMELAGLSVAQAIAQTCVSGSSVTLVCGPGNNGGDGLVAARHLFMFGYNPCVVYPKISKREPFIGLLQQLHSIGADVHNTVQVPDADVVVDCVFGFSFSGESIREPFGQTLKSINETTGKLVCVDVPSGWQVDGGGKVDGAVKQPQVLISLTAPKLVAKDIQRCQSFMHFVGGRFVPDKLKKELAIQVPDYQGVDQIVRLE